MKNVRFMSIIIGIVLSFCVVVSAAENIITGTIIGIGSASGAGSMGYGVIDVLVLTPHNKTVHVIGVHLSIEKIARGLAILNYAKERNKPVTFYKGNPSYTDRSYFPGSSFPFSDFEVDGMRFVER